MISHDAHIFVTGGAGYLGRALSEWAKDHRAGWRFTVYSRDETKHYQLRRAFPHHDYVLGDVRDLDRLALAMRGHDVVIHAAANKYVPQAEMNVREAIAINIDGSENVAKAAIQAQVQRVIGISTDKACLPVNVYGITKQIMERLFQEYDRLADTQFNLIRYGNVVGSTGSVIPIFQRQARDTGVLKITDPMMTRFWLTVWQAVELLAAALDERRGGTILIPELPSTTLEVTARAAAMSVGVVDAKIEVTGHRFGEQLHEWLVAPHETLHTEWTHLKLGGDRVGLMRMYPLTKPAPNMEGRVMLPTGFSSEWPDRELDVAALAALIKEAPPGAS